uniref:Uncharacterized protein n=1 Tax=Streptomyces sp. NBC_01393 TaxID=2903851 RepID=A0AAU3I7Z9_9ACTN
MSTLTRILADLNGSQLTAEDVEDAKRRAIRWLSYSAALNAQDAPAWQVLRAEVKRTRLVMRRALKNSGPEATMGAMRQHDQAQGAYMAALRFEGEKAADVARSQGWDHANYTDAYGGDLDATPEVPARFAHVADAYRTAYAEGVEAFQDRDDS